MSHDMGSQVLRDQESKASTQAYDAIKCSRRARNDQNWALLKRDIYRIYMVDDFTLQNTMRVIEEQHSFKARCDNTGSNL
jgi:hypothetical protein